MAQRNKNWICRFEVSEPRKHKKGFTVYKVTSFVFPKASPEAVTKIVAWKRYNDFKKLHRDLQAKHAELYLPGTFPAFAKSKMFGRFDNDVIEERRQCALTLLEFIGEHNLLFTSNVFVKFFESGYSVDDYNDALPGNPSQSERHSPVTVGEHIMTSSITDSVSNDCSAANNNSEVSKPPQLLGGTWQYPQVPECISLSSESSDDHTTFTDTDSSAISGVSSPLQNVDLQFFDPLQQSPVHQANDPVNTIVDSTESTNSWLLSAPPLATVGSDDEPSNSLLNQEEDKSLRDTPSPKPTTNIFLEIRSVVGHTEKPASSFLSVRTEDFEFPYLSNIQQMSKSNGLNNFLTLSSSSSSTSNLEGQVPNFPSVNYIFEAAYHTSQAKLNEANGEYEAAFAFYKAGIACLLSGVQDETDMKRKVVVGEKINKYLLHAETLYNKYIGTHSSDRTFLLRPQLCRPLSELRCYRVLGVVDKMMLVLNVVNDCCYVMKVLHKSPCPISQHLRTITPQSVPFMVTMHCFFETESAVFLVLQHVRGGKLWQHISSYFQSLPQTPVHTYSKKGNIYYGKSCLESHISKVASFDEDDLTFTFPIKLNGDCKPEESLTLSSQEQSYLDLIQEYTSSAKVTESGSDENVSSEIVFTSAICDNSVEERNNIHQMVISKKNIDLKDVDVEDSNVDNHPMLETQTCDDSNYTSKAISHSNPTPDLLSHSANSSYSWNILDTLPTQDLVKNAQRLIESVSETLMHSDIVISRLKGGEIPVESVSAPDLTPGEEVREKKCASGVVHEDSSDRAMENFESPNHQSTKHISSSTNRHSSNKRRSAKSLERRISTDDLLGGGARALSGSLDREWGCGPPRPRLPEGPIRSWGAQLLVCLDSLHRWGVTCKDLHPDNLLLGDKGQLMVTYKCQWEGVDALPNTKAVRKLYTAPEVSGILPITQAADWWSFGAILYELFTGRSLALSHPGGIFSHTIIHIPDHVSENAKSLLQELLRYNPPERLGAGVNGTEELKSHPFFSGVEWQTVLDEGMAA